MSLQDGHTCFLDNSIEFLAFSLVRELRLGLGIMVVSGRATRERCEQSTPPRYDRILTSFITCLTHQFSEYIARALSDYLTAETGITIIFESAIVPKWRDSRISFKNVFITRRPDNVRNRALNNAGHPVAAGYDLSNHPSYHNTGEEEDEGQESDPLSL